MNSEPSSSEADVGRPRGPRQEIGSCSRPGRTPVARPGRPAGRLPHRGSTRTTPAAKAAQAAPRPSTGAGVRGTAEKASGRRGGAGLALGRRTAGSTGAGAQRPVRPVVDTSAATWRPPHRTDAPEASDGYRAQRVAPTLSDPGRAAPSHARTRGAARTGRLRTARRRPHEACAVSGNKLRPRRTLNANAPAEGRGARRMGAAPGTTAHSAGGGLRRPQAQASAASPLISSPVS